MAAIILFTALLTLVIVCARIFFNGENLGAFVAELLNRRMRGRIDVASIEWDLRSLPTMLRGGWVPVTVTNVTLWDDCMQTPEGRARRAAAGPHLFVTDLPCSVDDTRAAGLTPRKKLLHAVRATAEIDIHGLLVGRRELVFRKLHVYGGEVLLEQTTEPAPLHDYDKTTISLISAFQPRQQPGFRAGIFADKPPPIFDLRDIHLEDVGLTFHSRATIASNGKARYPFVLRVDGISVDAGATPRDHAFLYVDGGDPLASKLYLSVPITASSASVRILDEGPIESFAIGPLTAGQLGERKPLYTIPLTSIDVQRLAQLPRRWAAGDPVASSLELRLTAKTAFGGVVDISGELRDYKNSAFSGTWALDVVGRNLGPTLTATIDPALSGDDVTARLALRGPFIANPRIEYQASGVRYSALLPKLPTDPPPLRLGLANLNGWIDLVNEQGAMRQTVAQVLGEDGKPKGGQVQLDATFGINPKRLNHADVNILEPIDVGRFLPPGARNVLGRFVRGRFSGEGDTEQGFELRDLDVAIGTTPADTRARLSGGRIFSSGKFSSIEIPRDEPVQARLGESKATASGKILTSSRWMDMRLTGVASPDLAVWLRRLGAGPAASFCKQCVVQDGGRVTISGNMSSLTADGAATIGGVPALGQVALDGKYADNVVELRQAQAGGLGGTLSAQGKIRLGKAPSADKLTISGTSLSAERLAAAAAKPGLVSGTVETLSLTVNGPLSPRARLLDWLDLVDAHLQADSLVVAGQPFQDVGVCVSHSGPTQPFCRKRDAALGDADEVRCDKARQAGGTCAIVHFAHGGGGALDFYASKTPRASSRRTPFPVSDLDGSIDIAALPMRILDALGKPGAVAGTLNINAVLGGTSDSPTGSGVIELLRTALAGSFLGDLRVAVTPVDKGSGRQAIRLAGAALGGRLAIEASIGTYAPFPVEVRVSGRRLELDPLVGAPTVAGFPLRAWATGEASLRTELAPVGRSVAAATELTLELSELGAIWDTAIGDLPAPLTFAVTGSSAGKLLVRATADKLEVVCRQQAGAAPTQCPFQLHTPAGTLALTASVPLRELRPQSFVGTIRGTLDLGRLPLEVVGSLASLPPLDELSGAFKIDGSIDTPLALDKALSKIKLELRPDNVRIRPTGQETVVHIPGGLIGLANGGVGFTDVRLLVDDVHQQERGELTIKGNIKLAGLRPAIWGVTIDGQVPGRLLMLAPTVVSQASGVVVLDPPINLMGAGRWPRVMGALVFDPQNPLTVIPRGYPREIAFRRGEIELGTRAAGASPTYTCNATGVNAVLDGEGQIDIVEGSVILEDLRPTKLSALMNVEQLPFQVPGKLDFSITGRRLAVQYDEGKPWRVAGTLEVVDGRFIQNFNLGDVGDALRPATPPPGANKPFWEEWPQAGAAQLDLTVDVHRMAVANNMANIEMAGKLNVRGTPRDPRINGGIAVSRGTFRFLGTRAEFTRVRGTVEFIQTKRFPKQNPVLQINAEADYRDPGGRDHLISLGLSGPYEELKIDLSTSTGYNRSQTLALLFLGKTPDQVRQSIGDTTLGSDPTRIDPTTNPSAGAADQLIKDVAGDWVSLLLGDSLEELTGLDVLRFQFDFGSIGLRGEKKITENLTGIFDWERTVRGATVNVRSELRTPFRINLQGTYLNKDFDSEAEEDIEEVQAKLVYRFYFP